MRKEIRRFTIWSDVDDGKTLPTQTTYRVVYEDKWYYLEYLKYTGKDYVWEQLGDYMWVDLGFLYSSDVFQKLFK